MRIHTFWLAVACTLPGLAAAQWQWIDPAGRPVFSDQPPPPGTPERSILRQPAKRVPSPAASADEGGASAPRPASVASAPRPPATDAAQEARRRQTQAEEAERRRLDEERVARQRADNCVRARSARATIDSGVRIARTNEKGEREILDDAARAAEGRRLQEIIESDCAAPAAPAARPAP